MECSIFVDSRQLTFVLIIRPKLSRLEGELFRETMRNIHPVASCHLVEGAEHGDKGRIVVAQEGDQLLCGMFKPEFTL